MHVSASGVVVNPRRASFVAATQGARAKIMVSNRKAREASSFNLRRDKFQAPAGAPDGKDGKDGAAGGGKGG